jgi:hypothetical protein
MHFRDTILALFASGLVACGPSTPSSLGNDAAPDTASDAALDTASDAALDTASDAALDTASDAALDTASDAALDTAADAAPDATLDAALDAAPDTTATTDLGGDVASLDAFGDAVACRGETPSCVAGTAGGACSDALTLARCEGGAWRCGAGEVLASQCACIGRPPGASCVCTSSGWSCTDAAVRDAVAADALCLGRPAGCVSGVAGGACGDAVSEPTCVAGAWTCPAGQVPLTACACVGRPPGSGCVCTPSGWSCPDAAVPDVPRDGGVAGTRCGSDTDCAEGLLCCYPCGIPGCTNQCTAPMRGRCPLIP